MNAKWKIIVAACAAVATLGSVSAQAGVSDAWITTKVKMSLLTSSEASGLPINVDTDEGRVTLHGKVPTSAEKEAAGRIAKDTEGVVEVRNLVQVVPKNAKKAVSESDDKISDHVKERLKAEPALESSSIGVKSVNKGVVLLHGKAETVSAQLLALEIAAETPGVKRVASEIEGPDKYTDRELWDDPQAGEPGGNLVTDAWITTKTKVKFMTDDQVPAGDINVDTRRGVVTLFGTVPNKAAGDRARKIAGEVSGVRAVNSELRVVAPSKKAAETRDDLKVQAEVRRRLDKAGIPDTDVQVEVKAGTARLTGTVNNASERYQAMTVAHGTPGVDRIVNDVRVDSNKVSAK